MKGKLIISCASLAGGGAERVISNLSYSFPDEFETVIIVMWCKYPIFYQVDKRVKLICIEDVIKTRNELKRMKWFRSYIKKEKPDILLSFLMPYNLRVLLCTIGLGIKTVVAERNDPHSHGNIVIDIIEKIMYRFADAILVQTETVKKFFTGSLSKKTFIIYNPIRISEDYIGKAINVTKKKRIVSVARLEKLKNHEMLINAFIIFKKNHDDYDLTIYGEGPYRGVLEEIIRNEHLDNCIHLPGIKNNVWEECLDAKCFALCSRYEGMPNSLFEAMCLGLPCVSTKVSGAVDLIKNKQNGILVEYDDAKAMADAFSFFVDNENDTLHIAKSATKIYDLLRFDVISQQWIDFLKKYNY